MRRPVLVLVGLTLAGGMALADGGFFAVYEGVANTADQRAIVVDHGGSQTIVLQTAYEGDASDFAWVIPVPSLIAAADAVGTTDPEVFPLLNRITAPRSVSWRSTSAACGCGGSGGDGQAGGEQRAGVTVWETLQVENYDVAVLSADDSGDLAGWLHENGYGFPAGHEDTLAYYVDRQSFFVTFRISPSDEDGDPDPGNGAPAAQDLRPITLTFDTAEIIFPIRISQASTLQRAEVLLYVISTERMKAANYATAQVQTPPSWRGDSFTRAYDDWLEATIDEHGGTAIVVEYADYLSDFEIATEPLAGILDGPGPYFVTRMRTRLAPEQMQEDIMLIADGTRRFGVVVSDGIAELRGKLALGFMIFAGLQAALFRTHRGRRTAWATALFAIMVAIL